MGWLSHKQKLTSAPKPIQYAYASISQSLAHSVISLTAVGGCLWGNLKTRKKKEKKGLKCSMGWLLDSSRFER